MNAYHSANLQNKSIGELLRTYKQIDKCGYSNLIKTYTRKDSVLLQSGYYDTQAWGALKKCWKRYRIAKSQGDFNRLRYYAKGVQKFERELGIEVTDFPQIGILAIDVE
jgi:hypothetical protein